MVETKYREHLDLGFRKYSEKMSQGTKPEFYEHHHNFQERWAVKFALHATAKFTQELFAQAENLNDTETTEFYQFYFAIKRINASWAGMEADSAPDFETLKKKTFTLLEELTDPDAVEFDYALEDDGRIIRATTDAYKDILAFLQDHAVDSR